MRPRKTYFHLDNFRVKIRTNMDKAYDGLSFSVIKLTSCPKPQFVLQVIC